MKLKWYGHSCFAVESGGFTAVFDPYADGHVPGYAPLRLTADVVFCSHEHRDHSARECVTLTRNNAPFAVETVASLHDNRFGLLRGKNTIHILSAEGMRIAHLGDLGHRLKGTALEKLRGVDALLIPVGGHYTIDAPTAKRIVTDIAPRVVIPMHYRFGEMGYDVIAELSDFTSLCENVVTYDGNTLDLTAETPAQTAVLRYVK